MLGTNDADIPITHIGLYILPPSDHRHHARHKRRQGPGRWGPQQLHNCGGADGTTLKGCSFADDYASMIEEVQPLIKYLRPYKYLINRK